MTVHKRARRGDAERIDNEGRELRWLEGGDVRLAPVQPAWYCVPEGGVEGGPPP